ncbi:MAG TPA: glycosyltransferase family 39 protein [Methylomirabilota bacterium]|nr:glycosyltransferase family 39 protein [Methylomirabilota bacterium]
MSTWNILSATYDEPYHIAAGMEWLDKGTYTYESQHPPLARVALALGPYLRGLRSCSRTDAKDEGYAILYSAGNYKYNLAAARSGNLPFFVLGCLVVFLWARRWFGRAAAVWGVLLFVNLPPILGHAGLATLDMACAASGALAMYAFLRCLEEPAWQRLVLLCVSLALAFLCKFSSLPFLGACFLCGFAVLALEKGAASLRAFRWRHFFGRVGMVSAAVLVLLWGGYRFSWAPVAVHTGDIPEIDANFANRPFLRSMAYKAVQTPIPLGQFLRGLRVVSLHNEQGHGSYLLGEFRETGWWYFFPVVVGVKTPIGFLILAGLGIVVIMRGFQRSAWQQRLTVIFPVAIFLVCMGTRIDLGVRHILAIYPPLAVLAGYAASECLALARRTWRPVLILPIVLVAWVVAGSWMARPDYLAYFNQFAGAHPERILAESDLDWGQDLYRLSDRLRGLHVDRVSIRYFGTAPLEKAGLPPYSMLSPDVPTTHGYVAVSVRFLTLEYARNGSFAWLKNRPPHEIVGKSIYLYNFDP